MEDLFLELKKKYKSIGFPPDPECHHCKGTGENSVLMSDGSTRTFPCMCLYFDHNFGKNYNQEDVLDQKSKLYDDKRS